MAKVLMKGNEAIAMAAIKGGCRYYFGYPITPQTELLEYMARELPKAGGVFVQAESEVAAINMVYGAAAAGGRVTTTSSSPGYALMQEGISYIAAAEIPCVIVNISRGGPGLGNIQPSQSDYFQNTRGGGNGDYRLLIFAPANLQETVDLVKESFALAQKYRMVVLISADGMLGQMMEPVEIKEMNPPEEEEKEWALTATEGKRPPRVIYSLYLDPVELEKVNERLHANYLKVSRLEERYELFQIEDAQLVIVAYGSVSRIVKSAISLLASEGIKVGLIRPISLWPFPEKAFEQIPNTAKGLLTVELSQGQMVDDVKIAAKGALPVYFYGRSGGMIPSPMEIADEVKRILGGAKS
jgi:2-oxoglutarate ferredoxin oxidoreductase subunit alpha